MPVDLSGQIFEAYERALRRAKALQVAGYSHQAAVAYHECARLLREYAGYIKDRKGREEWVKRADEYEALAKQVAAARVAIPTSETAGATEENYHAQVEALIHKVPISWDDIGGLEEIKQEIKAAYGLSLARKPKGVKLRGWRYILLYGPPGTGKTLLAAATSNGLEATFFSVKVSDLLSKYFGESSKIVSALFDVARQRAPSVIFIDEFESLSTRRDGTSTGAEARIVSTFLAELDGLEGKWDERYVLTMAASNLPWLIDKAILSRFDKKIYVPLPDAAARRAILEIHLSRKGLKTQVPYEELVERCAGYSGREIERLCLAAVRAMVDRSNPGLLAAVDAGLKDISNYELNVVPLTAQDFAQAFASVQPETSARDLEAFERWRRQQDV